METAITVNMLPDILAVSMLATLAVYHLMVFRGRRKDANEKYNLYFAFFVISATLFVIAPYLQPQYFLYAIKPSWLYVLNIEALMSVCLYFSGIAFLNALLKPSSPWKRYFYFTYITIPLNFLLTLTANFIGTYFYFAHILVFVLAISVINVAVIFLVYGVWMHRQKLFRENFYRVLYLGFVALTLNILVYRSIELLTIPNILIANHYVSVIVLFAFAYALSMKFNREYGELKELKISLEQKVADRTEALEKSNLTLEQQKSEIENLNEARSRFFTGISHEFRTPLTLIIGPLEALLSRVIDDETKRDYELMLRQSKRLMALMNQLLEVSKLEKGVQKLKVQQNDFCLFMQSTVEAYQLLAGELGIVLTLTEEKAFIPGWFDQDKVEKIVSNLITNALKFTKNGGHVEIILREDHGLVVLIVRDDGIGIARDQLKNIFDPFFQVDNTSTHAIEGAGFGLSMVKELVALHHGTIEVVSEVDRGTAFTVTFPITVSSYTPEEIENAGNESPSAATILDHDHDFEYPPSERSVILIVEDNVDMREYIKSTLPLRYLVLEAENGKLGFELATESIPDIIIADVMMPKVSGLQMTMQLKQDERTSHIPVIMLTAKASIESRLEGLTTQANDYLTKPFNSSELILRIQNLLTNRDRMREKFSKSITVNPSELVASSLDEKFLQKALAIVERNMAEGEMNAADFCDAIGMSRANVHRKLKALTGQSVTQFVMSIKLKRAAQLLRQKAGTISEIAYQTGFNNLSYFTRSFKEYYGVLPSRYNVEKE